MTNDIRKQNTIILSTIYIDSINDKFNLDIDKDNFYNYLFEVFENNFDELYNQQEKEQLDTKVLETVTMSLSKKFIENYLYNFGNGDFNIELWNDINIFNEVF